MWDASEINVPMWLNTLLSEKFFNACIIHEGAKNNEKNMFCLDCCEAICLHCLQHHGSHRLLQVRRYIYHDVITLVDAEKLMDCAHVQSYTTNSSKVVFFNERPTPKTRAKRALGNGNLCITCDRNLQETSLYCSLSCKLQHIARRKPDPSMYLASTEPGLREQLVTPGSILESTGSVKTESISGSHGPTHHLKCTPTTELDVKVKPVCLLDREVLKGVKMNRLRKGTPNRSPLY